MYIYIYDDGLDVHINKKPSDIRHVFQRATPWRQPPDAFH